MAFAVSDEILGTFVPTAVYRLYSGLYVMLDGLEEYRLHPKGEEKVKNIVSKGTVVKGVLVQQAFQVAVSLLLFTSTSAGLLRLWPPSPTSSISGFRRRRSTSPSLRLRSPSPATSASTAFGRLLVLRSAIDLHLRPPPLRRWSPPRAVCWSYAPPLISTFGSLCSVASLRLRLRLLHRNAVGTTGTQQKSLKFWLKRNNARSIPTNSRNRLVPAFPAGPKQN